MKIVTQRIKTSVIIIGLLAALPAFGMETYPCDNCHQEKEVLNRRTYDILKKTTNYECLHILCNECNGDIWQEKWKPKDKNNKIWWYCPYCDYFYNQHKKQCWKPKNIGFFGFYTNEPINDARDIAATEFKSQYPNRELPDVTDTTIFPRHPRDPQNINQPNQHGQNPPHQNPNNPNNPQPTNSFVIDNNIKYLGAAGVVAIVCYGAYKVYHWWKGEETKENDTEMDEWEKEEDNAKPVGQV